MEGTASLTSAARWFRWRRTRAGRTTLPSSWPRLRALASFPLTRRLRRRRRNFGKKILTGRRHRQPYPIPRRFGAPPDERQPKFGRRKQVQSILLGFDLNAENVFPYEEFVAVLQFSFVSNPAINAVPAV